MGSGSAAQAQAARRLDPRGRDGLDRLLLPEVDVFEHEGDGQPSITTNEALLIAALCCAGLVVFASGPKMPTSYRPHFRCRRRPPGRMIRSSTRAAIAATFGVRMKTPNGLCFSGTRHYPDPAWVRCTSHPSFRDDVVVCSSSSLKSMSLPKKCRGIDVIIRNNRERADRRLIEHRAVLPR